MTEQNIKLTKLQRKALEIIKDKGQVSPMEFAQLYFTEEKHQYLFTAVSNQGNGACAGKKAWLSAGSLLNRLCKRGYVYHKFVPSRYGKGRFVYCITDKGVEALENKEGER
jgi:hypothetical protein